MPVPKIQLGRLFIRGAIPMVGFGFVDNVIMISMGDAIDMTLGATFGISTLAAGENNNKNPKKSNKYQFNQFNQLFQSGFGRS